MTMDRDVDSTREVEQTPADVGSETAPSDRRLLLNCSEAEEIRAAVVERGVLREFYFDHVARSTCLGNVYKARVVNVEPSIGAAFVDFGGERNGFLHESDIVPGTSLENGGSSPTNGDSADSKADRGRRANGGKRRSIADLVTRGQEIIVQVNKDGIGTKGPTLTTNVGLPGRYLVLMPHIGRLGVSRRIAAGEERLRLRRLLEDLHPPAGMGYIVRTAGLDKSKAELQKDLRYLLHLWSEIQGRIASSRAPSCLYRESDLVTRVIRDVLTPDTAEIIVDTDAAFRACHEMLGLLLPGSKLQGRLRLHRGRRPLFHEHGIEPEIAKTFSKRVELRQGGSILIEPTEALVAIDVNSGKFRDEEDPEETAFKTNLEAVPEIVRQVRLRDLGGVLVIDFIDMQEDRHRRAIEKALRAAMREDRARVRIAPMSEFGIVEVTRQRVRPGFGHANFAPCSHCAGSGLVRIPDSMSVHVLREIRDALASDDVVEVIVTTSAEIATHLLNVKRRDLRALEDETRRKITICVNRDFRADSYQLQTVRGDARRPASS
ncbi:MAG: Rne/Rng family ribonuclease [Planctomycetes bacterium]|nr:Rne/Rng family ribonuclease [Planctomycetota bacterium]MBI3845055.1 Rne/Rng family ribonuclease [Planctomycetota bacterium]